MSPSASGDPALPSPTGPRRYGAIVSLGAACQVAEQCRRHLGAAPGGPLDWLITPFDSIEKVLSDMGARFGQRFITVRDGYSPQCFHYGVLYEHDFERDEDSQVIYDLDHIHACRGRMTHNMGKLAAILKSPDRVLFIRAYSSTGVEKDRFNTEVLTSDHLNALVATIEGHVPDLDFDLLFIHSPDRTAEKTDFDKPLSKRVILREMPHPPDMQWYGIDADWRALFDDLGLIGSKADRSRSAEINTDA